MTLEEATTTRGPITPATGVKRTMSGLYVRALPGIKLRDRKATRLMRRCQVAMPWLQPSDMPTLRGWAQVQILADQVYAILRAAGPVKKDGEARRLLHDFRQLRLAQLQHERELGMTPSARAALKTSGTREPFDLISAFAQSGGDDAEDGPEVPADLAAPVQQEQPSDGDGDGEVVEPVEPANSVGKLTPAVEESVELTPHDVEKTPMVEPGVVVIEDDSIF